MYKYFLCPDGQTVTIEQCINQCRMSNRCMSLPTLRFMAEQRIWSGKPSTTQLLKGTREAYLHIIHEDLILDPQKAAFRILGTKSHDVLEQYSSSELSEIRLEDDLSTGEFDCYDAENETLYDYKTWGSYKVMMATGIEMVDVETGGVFKTGARAGQPKTRKEPQLTGRVNMYESVLQMNDYRMKIEATGFGVKKMYIEAVVRDGGTIAATSRGIMKNIYLIPVPILEDMKVHQYFKQKSLALLGALRNKVVPQKCTSEECWDGRKCEKYCDVYKHCNSHSPTTERGISMSDKKLCQ